MAVPRFYFEALSAGEISLTGAQADHARRSRRLSVGDGLVLFNGRGGEAYGVITGLDKRSIRINIEQLRRQKPKVPALTLGVALPKGSRQDTLIEKCTELGVTAIQPLETDRSVAKATRHKTDKWRRNVIEAAKQSQQCWLPRLYESCRLQAVLQQIDEYERKLVATVPAEYPHVETQTLLQVAGALSDCKSMLVLVGPEGGWSENELEEIIGAGVQPVVLGPNVLRVETAAITVAAMIHAAMTEDEQAAMFNTETHQEQ